nr:hypothetical protein [Rhodococcus sp. (in: high G+C Gram-positive bacteria)]
METVIVERVRAQCTVTVSIGAVHAHLTAAMLDSLETDGVVDRLVHVADRALYTAKNTGRDRIVYSHSAVDPWSFHGAPRVSTRALSFDQ